MVLINPVWLLLAIPLAVSVWLFRARSRFLVAARVIMLALILLAMCDLSIRIPSRHGTVVVIADRSASMPPDAASRQKEAIELIQADTTEADNLAVVSFGGVPVIEHPPQSGKFAGFISNPSPDGSVLADAMETALSLIPGQSPGRILVLSDGRWTGKDPVSAASKAATRNIAVDYRLLERSATNDLALLRIDTPSSVTTGESFIITAWVKSPVQQEISYRLDRNGALIAAGTKPVVPGFSRLTFRDKAGGSGTLKYVLSVSGGLNDPIIENNTAKILVGVEGQKPLLCVTNSGQKGLVRLLAAGGLDVQASLPTSVELTIEGLSGYSAIIIEDVGAGKIGTAGMENLAGWVTHTGSGLIMTGGKDSYGLGGYFKSPLETIMPVSMELRREHRKLSVAIVVALDRSGSMTAPVGGGRRKIDLANLATVEVLKMLSPMDEIGVIAVDSSAHTIVDLGSVEKNIASQSKILSIDSMGGGIFIYEALSRSAAMLANATPLTRHIILFADAADSEEPGEYKELLKKCTEAGITVSVVGLGRPENVDSPLLVDVALRGNGRIFFTESAEELPRLFAQDTFVVARNTFIDEPTQVRITPSMITIAGRQWDIDRSIGGYNLCYLRPGAEMPAVTVDDYNAPVVAAWHCGSGRVLCYTGQADGPFTGDIAGWDKIGQFHTSMARWAAGVTSNLGPDMALTQELIAGNCLIKLHLDPARKDRGLTAMPKVRTLYGVAGQTPAAHTTTMRFEDSDTLAAEIPVAGSSTYLSTVEIPGIGPVTLSPVCLPYSPEFEPAEPYAGASTLARIAKITNGIERIKLSDIWSDLPKRPRLSSMKPWLLILVVIILLIEVLERRMGLIAGVRWNRIFKPIVLFERRKAQVSHRVERPEPQAAGIPEQAQAKRAAKTEEKPVADAGLIDAMSKARRSAKSRTDHK
ncbi:MAG: VWA domain-containing protein [Sedimentisphaerales bacterium]|nr:VWA domain-containing protein [Sedimentisphaerales bacterium]